MINKVHSIPNFASKTNYTAVQNKEAETFKVSISNAYKSEIRERSMNSITLKRDDSEDALKIKELSHKYGMIFANPSDVTVYDVEAMTDNTDIPYGIKEVVGYHSVGGGYTFNFLDDTGTRGQVVIAGHGSKDLFASPSFETKDGRFPTLDDETFKQNIMKAITMQIETQDAKEKLIPGTTRDLTISLDFDEKTKNADLQGLSDMLIWDLEHSYQCRNHTMVTLSDMEKGLLDGHLKRLAYNLKDIVDTK